MSAALAAVAVLLGLFALLLAVPVELAFRLERIEAFKGEIAIRWLFGLIRLRVPIPGEHPSRVAKALAASQPRARPAKRVRPGNALAVLRQASFRRRVYRLVEDLIRAVRLRALRLRARLGLGDPAETGRLWALLGPLGAAAQSLRNAQLRVEPDFMDEVFEFEAEGRLLLVPLQFLLLAIGFALSPDSIRAWRSLHVGHA